MITVRGPTLRPGRSRQVYYLLLLLNIISAATVAIGRYITFYNMHALNNTNN